MRHRKQFIQKEENPTIIPPLQKTNLIIIKTTQQDQYYKTINLTSLLDKNLSFKAKGLHSYIMTRPDNWQLWSKNLFSVSADRETSVRSAINELIENKYLFRTTIRDKKKKIKSWVYIAFSIPTEINKQLLEKLDLENLKIGSLKIENQDYSNKIYSNKKDSINILSKDNIGVSSKHLTSINKIISFWNSLPRTQKHSIPEIDEDKITKTYKIISLHIDNLLSGKPLVRNKDNFPSKPYKKFLTEYKIPFVLHTMTWIEKDIIDMLEIFSETQSAKSAKMSLSSVFWNNFAKIRGGGFSWFIHTAANTDLVD